MAKLKPKDRNNQKWVDTGKIAGKGQVNWRQDRFNKRFENVNEYGIPLVLDEIKEEFLGITPDSPLCLSKHKQIATSSNSSRIKFNEIANEKACPRYYHEDGWYDKNDKSPAYLLACLYNIDEYSTLSTTLNEEQPRITKRLLEKQLKNEYPDEYKIYMHNMRKREKFAKEKKAPAFIDSDDLKTNWDKTDLYAKGRIRITNSITGEIGYIDKRDLSDADKITKNSKEYSKFDPRKFNIKWDDERIQKFTGLILEDDYKELSIKDQKTWDYPAWTNDRKKLAPLSRRIEKHKVNCIYKECDGTYSVKVGNRKRGFEIYTITQPLPASLVEKINLPIIRMN
jgi:hypothetical protein